MRLLRPLGLLAAALCFAGAAQAAPLHYDIRAQLDPATGRISARAVVTVPHAEAEHGASFMLGDGYRVTALSGSPNAVVEAHDDQTPFPGHRLTITAKPGSRGDLRMTVVYEGAVPGPPNAVAADRVELSADGLWYPLPADFGARFAYDAEFHGLPKGAVVASPDQVRPSGDRLVLRRTTPRQDIAFTASPLFHTTRDGALRFFGRDLDSDYARDFRTYCPKALTYFQAWFGPLPGGKAVVAIVDRKDGQGYSRQGYLVVADIGPQAGAEPNPWGKVGYIAHELSHSWWSNASFTGEDYWLVESTAEYSSLRFLETQLGEAAMTEILDRKKVRAARAGPILGHGRPNNDAVYGKGPLLLFDLEKAVGRPVLDAVLADLARKPDITTADFLARLSARAGPEAAKTFEARLRQ